MTTVDRSHSLLGKKERITLEWLSAFQGGCTLGAEEVVCTASGVDADEILDLISNLHVVDPVPMRQRLRTSRTKSERER